MPKKYTLETLPKPNSQDIHLIPILAQRYAVIRFRGLADDESVEEHTAKLQTYIEDNKLKAIGTPIFAFYNPPWTLPFLRRNEIMVQIE